MTISILDHYDDTLRTLDCFTRRSHAEGRDPLPPGSRSSLEPSGSSRPGPTLPPTWPTDLIADASAAAQRRARGDLQHPGVSSFVASSVVG
jgi:hypothetical protein